MATRTEQDAAPAPLSTERVLRAAVALADERGIESLSMRTLAQELGAGAMSLYHYFPSKDELLGAMVDLVVGEFESDGSDRQALSWKESLRTTAMSAHEVLMRHRWAASIMLSGRESQARLRYMESILRSLRQAGFSAEMTHHAYHALESHIMGFTLWLVGMALDEEKLPGLAAAFLEILPRDEFPYVAEHIETHLVESTEYKGSEFEFGLELILDGLERLRAPA